jgi:hypothetical protein
MGESPPRELDAAAIGRCAGIVAIQHRHDFDLVLAKLITIACRMHNRPLGATRERAARAKILKTGKAL